MREADEKAAFSRVRVRRNNSIAPHHGPCVRNGWRHATFMLKVHFHLMSMKMLAGGKYSGLARRKQGIIFSFKMSATCSHQQWLVGALGELVK